MQLIPPPLPAVLCLLAALAVAVLILLGWVA